MEKEANPPVDQSIPQSISQIDEDGGRGAKGERQAIANINTVPARYHPSSINATTYSIKSPLVVQTGETNSKGRRAFPLHVPLASPLASAFQHTAASVKASMPLSGVRAQAAREQKEQAAFPWRSQLRMTSTMCIDVAITLLRLSCPYLLRSGSRPPAVHVPVHAACDICSVPCKFPLASSLGLDAQMSHRIVA